MQGLKLSIVLLVTILSITKQICADTKTMTDPKIDPELLQQLQNGGKASMLIEMKDSVQTVTDSFAARQFATRAERLTALNQELTAFTEKSQKNVIAFLGKYPADSGITYESLWIANTIVVKNADLKLAQELAKFDEISKISPDRQMQLFG